MEVRGEQVFGNQQQHFGATAGPKEQKEMDRGHSPRGWKEVLLYKETQPAQGDLKRKSPDFIP